MTKLIFPIHVTGVSIKHHQFLVNDGVMDIPDGIEQDVLDTILKIEGVSWHVSSDELMEPVSVIDKPVPELIISDDKTNLINKLTLAGIKVDARWGLSTLKKKSVELDEASKPQESSTE